MDVNDDAGCLDESGCLDVFREHGSLLQGGRVDTFKTVGASLLAMDVNDDAGCLDERGAWAFFASKLAPTGDRVRF
ncbi:hypothetical protein ACF6ZU_19140 [Pseudomonas migulae]|jgi:hypothetical protein|uniref:hypothetical protein n=1 Tax=Pseudomonas migulae TaxID=78543 RepID=UPI00372356E2